MSMGLIFARFMTCLTTWSAPCLKQRNNWLLDKNLLLLCPAMPLLSMWAGSLI